MSLLKVNEVQNYNGSSLTLTASTVSTSAQLNTGGNISVTGSLNVSDDSTTRSNLGLGSIATQDSSNVTITGGNISNATLASSVTFPAGHVLQVVQFLDNSNSVSTSSSTLVDAVDGSTNPILEKNITITSGNSVLVIANFTQQISGGGADKAGVVGLKRILDPSGAATTSTVYQQGTDAIYAESQATSANLTITMNNNICYLDSSTSSATSITYRLMHSAGIRGGNSLIRGNSYYTMTLLEIQS